MASNRLAAIEVAASPRTRPRVTGALVKDMFRGRGCVDVSRAPRRGGDGREIWRSEVVCDAGVFSGATDRLPLPLVEKEG